MSAPQTSRLVAAADPALVAAHVAATIRPDIQALAAYPVAKAEGLIKLDAMENPFGLTAHARSAEARIDKP